MHPTSIVVRTRSNRIQRRERRARSKARWHGPRRHHPVCVAPARRRGADGRAAGASPNAQVIGCTTAGEFTEQSSGTGSVSLLALGKGKVARAAAALARFDGDVAAGIARAAEELERALDLNLREADPRRVTWASRWWKVCA